jgi:hypothetical protein
VSGPVVGGSVVVGGGGLVVVPIAVVDAPPVPVEPGSGVLPLSPQADSTNHENRDVTTDTLRSIAMGHLGAEHAMNGTIAADGRDGRDQARRRERRCGGVGRGRSRVGGVDADVGAWRSMTRTGPGDAVRLLRVRAADAITTVDPGERARQAPAR